MTAVLGDAGSPTGRDAAYLGRLMPLLAAAAFFQGYAGALPAAVLSRAGESLGMESSQVAAAILVIGLGSVAGFFLTLVADRSGRKPVLVWATFGFCIAVAASGTAQTLVHFAAGQLIARVLLVAASAATVVIAAEEFPTGRRGRVIGVVSGFAGIGLVAAAVAGRLPGDSGWRLACLVTAAGIIPAGLIRSQVEETVAFASVRARMTQVRKGLLSPSYRRQVVTVGLLFFLVSFGLFGAATWWPRYASEELGMAQTRLDAFLAAAYLAGIPGYFFGGMVQDAVGRRRAAMVFLLAAAVAGAAVFAVPSPALQLPLIAAGAFFALASFPVLSALSAELFPTEIRARASVAARVLFGTAGAILGPLAVGILGDPGLGLIGEIGNSAMFVVLALVPAALMAQVLPETGFRTLERISAAAGIPSREPEAFRPS